MRSPRKSLLLFVQFWIPYGRGTTHSVKKRPKLRTSSICIFFTVCTKFWRFFHTVLHQCPINECSCEVNENALLGNPGIGALGPPEIPCLNNVTSNPSSFEVPVQCDEPAAVALCENHQDEHCATCFRGYHRSDTVVNVDCSSSTIVNPSEESRSYSTFFHNNDHKRSMLDSPQAWSALTSQVGEFMVIDVGSNLPIGGLAVQRRRSHNQHVTSFYVNYWKEDETVADASSVDGGALFSGYPVYANDGQYAEVMFAEGVVGRYFEIVVQSWENHVSMRAGVIQCNEYIDISKPTVLPGATETFSCLLNNCVCQDGTAAIGPVEHLGLLCTVTEY